MKLTVFNGSPRGTTGNTQAVIAQLIRGFEEAPGNSSEIIVLRDVNNFTALAQQFSTVDMAVLAFPLYMDSMPAAVKEFIEALRPYCGRPGNPTLGFVVISGFPEAIHTSFMKRYLEKLAGRLGCPYAGTVTKGNVEGIRPGSEKAKRRILDAFRDFGCDLAASRRFDEDAIVKLAGAARFSKTVVLVFNLLRRLGLVDRRWNNMLRRNNAFEKRFDQPYV